MRVPAGEVHTYLGFSSGFELICGAKKRPCKFACQWFVPRILNAYEWMELLDRDQCATIATNIFSWVSKPELRDGLH